MAAVGAIPEPAAPAALSCPLFLGLAGFCGGSELTSWSAVAGEFGVPLAGSPLRKISDRMAAGMDMGAAAVEVCGTTRLPGSDEKYQDQWSLLRLVEAIQRKNLTSLVLTTPAFLLFSLFNSTLARMTESTHSFPF